MDARNSSRIPWEEGMATAVDGCRPEQNDATTPIPIFVRLDGHSFTKPS